MPAHNWKGIDDGTFHDMHGAWIQQIRKALNSGILPRGFEAKSEQWAAEIIPDVLTLEVDRFEAERAFGDENGGTAVLAPPKALVKTSLDVLSYASRQNHVVVRHASGKRIVAVFEIVSRGNKASSRNFEEFMTKARSCLRQGIHFTFVDVHPPGNLDPFGIHGEIVRDSGGLPHKLPRGKKLSTAAYEAGAVINAYMNPFGVGDTIPGTPLFLRRSFHVMLPLEKTYDEAFTYFAPETQEAIRRNENRH